MQLNELGGAKIDVPREIGAAIKAFEAGIANAQQQQICWRFIIDNLAGVDRASFLFLDEIPMLLAWREGRRWVGIGLREIVTLPLTDPEPPPLPPARTQTEAYRRRGPDPE